MNSTVKISPDAELKRFAIAFVGQAIRELNGSDPVQALDAALWLTDDDAPMWFECCGMPFADGFKMLTSGAARQFTERYKKLQSHHEKKERIDA